MAYCPTCNRDRLEARRSRGWPIEVDRCSACGGMWFDAEELGKVLPQAVAELTIPRKAKETERLCPKCNRVLFAFTYPKTLVTVEMCMQCCGLWLDGGEFAEIKMIRASTEGKGTGAGFAKWGQSKNSFWELILKTMHEND